MEEKKADPELTSTIHLGVRAVIGGVDAGRFDESAAILSEEDREVVEKLAPDDAMLIVHRGPSKGARYLLSGSSEQITIGRAPESEVFLDDVTVSRKHAVIALEKKNFRLTDLGSLNGTYVNGEARTDLILKSGDEIQIGKFHMLFFGGNK
jgi:hypothetical protein